MRSIVLNLIVEKTETGEYWGYSPDLPGLHVLGETPAEVVNLAPGVAHTLLQVRREKKLKTPGKFAHFDGSQTITIQQGTPAHALSRTHQKIARTRV
ncbi:MAG: type II toxin-antitoxin system HicB family antitoxin [Chloroflexi bacterium]|nr:type II toxin-antitoxin system HicB family antitoxin [Chloroflexota bacterium]